MGARVASWSPDGDPYGRLGQPGIGDCLVREWLVVVCTSWR